MEHLWIAASVGAAFFQALRHASLKELNRHLSVMVTTYARVLFGLPLLIGYLVFALQWSGERMPEIGPTFLAYSCLAAIGQFAGTALMIRLFKLGNFAVGVMLTRTDVVLTAIIGSLLFSEVISAWGWVAIVITVVGVMISSAGRLPLKSVIGQSRDFRDVIFGLPTQIGLASGLVFAISYLTLRESILSMPAGTGPLVRSAVAAVAMTVWTFLILGIWLLVREPDGLARMRQHLGLCTFVGAASAFGTMGWFFATALANASYVAAVAQVQVAFTLLISRYWFQERITALELVGIATILAGVLMFRLV